MTMQRRKSPFTSATERLTVRLANDIRPDWILVLDDVEEGVTDRSFRMTAGDLGISDEFLRLETPIHVEITIGRTLQTFALKGRAQGEVHGDCSRCLTAASARFRAKLHLFAQRKDESAALDRTFSYGLLIITPRDHMPSPVLWSGQ